MAPYRFEEARVGRTGVPTRTDTPGHGRHRSTVAGATDTARRKRYNGLGNSTSAPMGR